MHMKTFLALLVFLFSSSVFAEDLPNSLFGIKLFKINNFVLGEEIKKYSKKSKIGNNYYLGHIFINNKIPKDNANVSNYAIYTDNNNAIVHIIGYKTLGKPDYKSSLNDYVCSEQKESLVESLKSYYSIYKFENIKLENKREDGDSLYFIDRDFIKISNPGSTTYNRVLAVECLYNFKESSFQIRLDSREYYSNLLMDYEIVPFFEFDLLENDLSGL